MATRPASFPRIERRGAWWLRSANGDHAFQGSARTIDHYDGDVTIRGLLLLYERNLAKAKAELK